MIKKLPKADDSMYHIDRLPENIVIRRKLNEVIDTVNKLEDLITTVMRRKENL